MSDLSDRLQAMTPKQRFRFAREIETRQAAGVAIPDAEAGWLPGYQTTSEYRGHLSMFEDYGESWLSRGD